MGRDSGMWIGRFGLCWSLFGRDLVSGGFYFILFYTLVLFP